MDNPKHIYFWVYVRCVIPNRKNARRKKQRTCVETRTFRPYEEIRIDFTVDRNANDRAVVYALAKGQKVRKKFNRETKKLEDVVENMPFYGWEDDILTNL